MTSNLDAAGNTTDKVPGHEKLGKRVFGRKIAFFVGARELKVVPKAAAKRLVLVMKAFDIRKNNLRKSIEMALFYVGKELGSLFFGGAIAESVAIRKIILNILRNITGRLGKGIKIAATKLARTKGNRVPQNLSRI